MGSAGYHGEFMGPLRKATTVFSISDRQTNITLARALLSEGTGRCVVLDIDAMYSSCADSIMKGLSEDRLNGIEIRIPSPDSDIESDFSEALSGESDLLLIDSLNSLNHFLSSGGSRSRGRKLAFAMAVLSAQARENDKTVILSQYKRERPDSFRRGPSISDLADITVSAEQKGPDLQMRCERGRAWPSGTFVLKTT